MDKFYNKNGDVAVLISGGFGAGWSTWANAEDKEGMAFDKDIAKIIVDNPTRNPKSFDVRPEDYDKIKEICAEKYPKAYLGGLDQLGIEWLPQGTDFQIHEYDGSESIWTVEDIKKYIA